MQLIWRLIRGAAWLACFLLLGELAVHAAMLPLPGPVAGMLLLYAVLLWRRRVDDGLAVLSGQLLGWLGLFFVPAGVGIVAHGPQFAGEAARLVVVMIASTLVTLLLTALAMRAFMSLQRRR